MIQVAWQTRDLSWSRNRQVHDTTVNMENHAPRRRQRRKRSPQRRATRRGRMTTWWWWAKQSCRTAQSSQDPVHKMFVNCMSAKCMYNTCDELWLRQAHWRQAEATQFYTLTSASHICIQALRYLVLWYGCGSTSPHMAWVTFSFAINELTLRSRIILVQPIHAFIVCSTSGQKSALIFRRKWNEAKKIEAKKIWLWCVITMDRD